VDAPLVYAGSMGAASHEVKRRRGGLGWKVALAILGVLALERVALAQPSPDSTQPTAPIRATFVSTSSQQWDVTIDGQPTCATPCTLPLYPLQFVALRSQEERPVVVEVGRLPPGDLIVSAKPMQHGITLYAVGKARDRDGMATAGLISGAAGAVSLVGGIYLMLQAVPGASVGPAAPLRSGATLGLAVRF
jgi:hypothetical protein